MHIFSANDVLLLEIIAGGTQFAAGDVTKDAFATLIDADQWMIYRNILTGVLHWDFVGVPGPFTSNLLTYFWCLECPRPIYILPCNRCSVRLN